MSAITQAFFDVLNGDSYLESRLSRFGTRPAIFTVDPPPGSPDFPFIISAGEASTVPEDTKTSYGREILRDISCFDDSKSAALVEDIAERVRALFHDQTITVAGYTTVLSEVPSGPIVLDGEGVRGRLVQVRLLLEEVP